MWVKPIAKRQQATDSFLPPKVETCMLQVKYQQHLKLQTLTTSLL